MGTVAFPNLLIVKLMKELAGDFVVIGSGPAGQKAAIQAAKLGRSVLIIDKNPHIGGASLNSGTIPSKSLREAIVDLTRFHERSFYGKDLVPHEVTLKTLTYRLSCVLEEERRVLARYFQKNDIRVISGFARFENPYEVSVLDPQGEVTHHIRAEHFIIASGSKPRNPLHVPFDDEVILDSTRLLAIDELPRSMLVLGGGIVGSEYASFFAALGTEVTVIDKREHLLPLLDSEIGIHLQTELSDLGLRFMGGKLPKKIERLEDYAYVAFEDGSHLEAETLLYALGRVANVGGMQLDRLGISLTKRGDIPVNPLFQTVVSNIYAVGDVIGAPALASTSMEQGRLAARHACDASVHQFPAVFPIGIYTIPEISSLGLTEDELQRLDFRYEVGRAYYYEIARGHISGSHRGMFKLIFNPETLEILGIHIIGRSATELIHIGQVAMLHRARIDFFVDQIFNYPTFAEGYRIAALNGLNKLHRSS